ncbi:hypothetical protein [Knoellia sp. LjRoot47]|uniref:hypothetical protein n=1 Tax=Knoellia sp. LjRoot47 TaxID=3342330 RepID=UPI003ED0A513
MLGGTIGASALLAGLMLVLPKFISREDYGHYQLYLFYATYLGYLSFGLADGLFLRLSGIRLTEIPGRMVSGHLRALAVLATIALGGIATFATLAVKDPATALVIMLACLSTWFYLVRSLITFVYQAANVVALYARSTVIERLVHVTLAGGVLVTDHRSFELLLWTDVAGRVVGLVYTLHRTWSVVAVRPEPWSRDRREILESLRGGLYVNLAALATVLVTGVSRFAAERGFGVAVFGEISLAFSLQNTLLTVLTPISLLILPSIRRRDPNSYRSIYSTGLNRVAPVLVLALICYLPMAVFVSQWLPDFRDLPAYIAALMPLVVFESRTRLFAIPFLQALRRERVLTVVNVACLLLAAALSWVAVSVLQSPLGLVLSLTVVVIVRTLLLELVTQRHLGLNRYRESAAELVVIVLFLVASSGTLQPWVWLPAGLAWAGYLWWQRNSLATALRSASAAAGPQRHA